MERRHEVAPTGWVNDAVLRLVRAQRLPLVGRLVTVLLRLRGTDISPAASIGRDVVLLHGGSGVVIHDRTRIRDRVQIFHRVTIGRGAIFAGGRDAFPGVDIQDDVVIGAGASIIAPDSGLTVGRGSVIGAGAVLTRSTGEWEVWAGNPARKLRDL